MRLRLFRAGLACALAACTSIALAKPVRDDVNHVITVSPQASAQATTADLKDAASFLVGRPDPGNTWTWRFMPGTYPLTVTVYIRNIRNVNLVSDPAAPARIVKDASWNTDPDEKKWMEYLLDVGFCRNMSMRGFELVGRTVDFPAGGALPDRRDQGVQFLSCDTVKVDSNSFRNFGNAALRFATLATDPIQDVNSLNSTVTNNRFDNIYQIATTSIDYAHGGTRSYLLANNVFTRLHGSVKFATRTTGASDVRIIDNLIDGSTHYGLEINNYETMEIRGNVFRNVEETAIDIYTNSICGTDPITKIYTCTKPFAWGSNFTVAGNVIERAGRGIVYDHRSYPDTYPEPRNNKPAKLVIEDNALSDIGPRDSAIRDGLSAIHVASPLGIDGVRVANNRFLHITNGHLVSAIPAASTNVVAANNTLLPARPVRDLNGNLNSELAWQEPAPASQLKQWPPASGWRAGPFVIPAGLKVIALADIDGDHRSDVVLRDPATNKVSQLFSSAPAEPKHLATVDSSYQLAATGDLNGDGMADLIWRRASDGNTVIWFMGVPSNNASYTSATYVKDASWQLIGTGDFDGDGKADLLWRQPGTANTTIWLMHGITEKPSAVSLQVDASSYMIGTGDFDGDGKVEILLRNPLTGLVTLVFGAATTQPRAESLAGQPPTEWHIGAIGDFNGDGRSDIAWARNADGQISIWWMNGSTSIGAQTVTGVDPALQVVR